MVLYQLAILLALVAFFGLTLRNLRDYRKPTARLPEGRPLVSICLPARNEARNIEACLRGLLAQEYPHFEVLVLDDCSEDTTGEIVDRIAREDRRVRPLPGRPIAPGWAGKCHACAQLAEQAKGDYLLFVDADTRAEPLLLGSALAVAEATGADLVSAFPRQVAGTFWEWVVMPMLQFLIVTLLPIRQVWESRSPALCAACGQFLLFRREAYCRVGGHGAIPGSFHDGLQLARRIKTFGGTVHLFDASDLLRCRMYEGGRAVWNGFTRNAYEGLGSFGALVGMTLTLGTLFLAPFIFLGIGLVTGAVWAPLCALQVAIVLLLRTLQAARFGHGASVLLFPLSVASLIAILWGSLWRTLWRRPIPWKGRRYVSAGQSRPVPTDVAGHDLAPAPGSRRQLPM